MGFYPVNPANGIYAIGSPILKSAEISLSNGKVFHMGIKNAGKANIYIQSVRLNGKPYDKVYITQDELMAGGNLEFIMGAKPNKNWGAKPGNQPPLWGYKE
jgi:putative alpha-1,2-mannosidase